MEEIIHASYSASLEEMGRRTMRSLNLTASAGENVYLYGSPNHCQLHFSILCGLKKPDFGAVFFQLQELHAMPDQAGAAFRRDYIGAIPQGGGLLPELSMIDQITLPMRLAGEESEVILSRLRELTSERMPLHSLYNLPGKCNPRKRAYASVFKAVIRNPQMIIVHGFMDECGELDADALWDTLLFFRPKDSVLIYLSGAPAPEQVQWTQRQKL